MSMLLASLFRHAIDKERRARDQDVRVYVDPLENLRECALFMYRVATHDTEADVAAFVSYLCLSVQGLLEFTLPESLCRSDQVLRRSALPGRHLDPEECSSRALVLMSLVPPRAWELKSGELDSACGCLRWLRSLSVEPKFACTEADLRDVKDKLWLLEGQMFDCQIMLRGLLEVRSRRQPTGELPTPAQAAAACVLGDDFGA